MRAARKLAPNLAALGRLQRSSFFRLAMLYALIFSLCVLLLLGFIYGTTAYYMSSQADELIDTEIQGLVEHYQRRGLRGLSQLMRERLQRNPDSGMLYLFADRNYQALEGNLNRWPDATPDTNGWLQFRLEHRRDPQGQSRLARARVFQFLPAQLHLLVGRDVHELEAIRSLIMRALTWGLVWTLGLGLIGGVILSASTLRRIESINRTSRDIMAGDLKRRIPTRGTHDDFDQLAGNLNAMLDRIEHLMLNIRQVSDDIAHDLKTPLARLRHHLERTVDEVPQAARIELERASAEADHLLSLFNTMLQITRVEAGVSGASEQPVDLTEVVRDVLELYEPLAEENGLSLTLQADSVPSRPGNRDQLFQCLANVLDNAVKFTPSGGKIAIRVAQLIEHNAQWIELRLADSGPGIPAAERENVFQRFYRLESSRQKPGSGLGLSLAAAIVEGHQGRIELSDNNPGLMVRILLPYS